MPTSDGRQPPPRTPHLSASHVARSAAPVAALFALDKVLGVVRDAAIGRAFGASPALDAYYAAFELPDGLFTVVAGAALTTSLIPVLTACIASGDRERVWRLVSVVVNWVLLVVAMVSVAAGVFAPQVIAVVAPGFDAERAALAVRLTLCHPDRSTWIIWRPSWKMGMMENPQKAIEPASQYKYLSAAKAGKSTETRSNAAAMRKLSAGPLPVTSSS